MKPAARANLGSSNTTPTSLQRWQRGLALIYTLRPYLPSIIVSNLVGILAAATEGLSITLIVPLIQAMQGSNSFGLWFDPSWITNWTGVSLHPIYLLVAVGLLLVLVKEGLLYAQVYVSARYEAGVIRDLRLRIFDQCHRMSLTKIQAIRPSSLMDLYLDQVESVTELLDALSAITVSGAYLAIYYWVVFGVSDSKMGPFLVALLVGGAAFLVARFTASRVYRLSQARTLSTLRSSRVFLDDLVGAGVVRNYNLTAHRTQLHSESSCEIFRAYLSLAHWSSVARPLMGVILAFVVLMGTLVLARDGFAPGPDGLAHLGAFAFILHRAHSQSNAIVQNFLRAKSSWFEASSVISFCEGDPIDKMFGNKDSQDQVQSEILELKPEKGSPSLTALSMNLSGESLGCRNVDFTYPGSKWTLKDVSLSVGTSTRVAVIGKTGSGKSTLVKLLAGGIKPDRGYVHFQGRPLIHGSETQLGSKLCVVSGDAFIFDNTVRYNILCGRLFDDPQVKEAVEAVEMTAYIDRLSMGYDTLVGYQGVEMSTGQKQRLCLARALVRNPEVLILDEATSCLDYETESIVLKNVYARVNTVLLISHRLETIRGCHEIIVMQDGVVASRGTHDELVQRSPAYLGLTQSRVQGTGVQI